MRVLAERRCMKQTRLTREHSSSGLKDTPVFSARPATAALRSGSRRPSITHEGQLMQPSHQQKAQRCTNVALSRQGHLLTAGAGRRGRVPVTGSAGDTLIRGAKHPTAQSMSTNNCKTAKRSGFWGCEQQQCRPDTWEEWGHLSRGKPKQRPTRAGGFCFVAFTGVSFMHHKVHPL